MGQYFIAINTETMQWLLPLSYDNSSNLMESAYIGNKFVGAVMTLLEEGNPWFNSSIVWCGDYFDEDGEIPYYSLVKKDNELKKIKSMPQRKQKKCILVNFSRKEYVDYSKNVVMKNGLSVNPLPLLTACGNNRGGGDYYPNNPDFNKVGIWANDRIGILSNIPYGFWELKVAFEINF